MKFCLSWLRDYLDFDASVAELCAKLTDIGLEVEEVIDEAAVLRDFEVALVEDAIKHENSDKLSICKVKRANGELLQIVCGAKNARKGIKVALAPVGSIIPTNGMVIKKAKIAGVESFGMMCSASELGLGRDSEGIIEIAEKWPLGTKIVEVFAKDDAVIDINVTPNRGDCLGVYGVARDLAAAGFGVLREIAGVDLVLRDSGHRIEAEDACGMALFRRIKGLKNCESPEWLKNRLEKVGLNAISAVVDVTNYVMWCLNRPMHAYDGARVSGDFVVRFGQKNEEFLSLKDEKYVLDDDILVIADEKQVLGVAGVIGSKGSGCDFDVDEIILEAAYFDKVAVANSGRKLGILSDARYRFERGVDYKSCALGMRMATDLILEICGGEAMDVEVVKSSKFDFAAKKIDFDVAEIAQITGVEVEKSEVLRILNGLGFICGEDFVVEVPSHRSDVDSSRDLIEEVIRIYGYDKITPQKIEITPQKHEMDAFDKVRAALIDKGGVENINWSFCDIDLAAKFAEIVPGLEIANPISENLNYMRPNLVIGLLNSYKKNALRGLVDGFSFEIGRVFHGDEPQAQPIMISGVRAGKNKAQNHYQDDRNCDIFDVKKDIFDIVEIFGLKSQNLQIDEALAPCYYHPHRSAALKLGRNVVAYFGELHPKFAKDFDLQAPISVFEIFAQNLPAAKEIKKGAYEVSDLQPILRDFAFVLDEGQKIGDLTKTIKNCEKKLIKDVEIFDIYAGKNIEEGKKSVALRVLIQPIAKSLVAQEIDEIAAKIIDAVAQKHGAKLRS